MARRRFFFREKRWEIFEWWLTLKEIKYLQTPDLLVDLISSSRWSRMTSLMYSYQARISVNSPNLPSRTLTLQGRNVNFPDFQHIDNFKHFCLNTSCCIWNFSLDLKASEGSAPATPVGITLVFVKDLSILNYLGWKESSLLWDWAYIRPGRHLLQRSVRLTEPLLNAHPVPVWVLFFDIVKAVLVVWIHDCFVDDIVGLICKDVQSHLGPLLLDVLDEDGDLHGAPDLLPDGGHPGGVGH